MDSPASLFISEIKKSKCLKQIQYKNNIIIGQNEVTKNKLQKFHSINYLYVYYVLKFELKLKGIPA